MKKDNGHKLRRAKATADHLTFENQHRRARKKKGKERKKMCVKQIWNKERIIKFQNRLKKKDFLARRRHK